MLRVCAVQHSVHGDFADANNSVARNIQLTKEYIPKHLVLRVSVFERKEILYVTLRQFNARAAQAPSEHDALRTTLGADHFGECKGNEEHDCACLKQCFPLFAIVVRNLEGNIAVNPSVLYLVHPSERENMQRFISGTDNTLHDYTEQLKYGPPDQEEQWSRNSHEARNNFLKRSREC